MRRQERIRMTQLIQAALNGPSMTIEELSDVGNAAMSEFEGLRGGEQTALAFVQSGKGVTHRLLHRPRILGNHRGFLPRAKNPCLGHPDYRPNRVPKRPNATVNKFRALTTSGPCSKRKCQRHLHKPRSTPSRKSAPSPPDARSVNVETCGLGRSLGIIGKNDVTYVATRVYSVSAD